jgi:hypothetical protein
MTGGDREPLKLGALDEEDLAVISAHMQDAVILVGDMSYSKKRSQFAMLGNRFDWDGQGRKPGKGGERRRAGLHFNRVSAVRSKNIRIGRDDAVLSLLAIGYEAGDQAPAGVIELTFSGGGVVRLEVESIDAALADLGPVWDTPNVPDHKPDEA